MLFSAATVGIAGNALGGPVGALVATIVAAELGKIVSKETRLDIIVRPASPLSPVCWWPSSWDQAWPGS